MNLKIIIGSTRPSRKGHLVADWFAQFAKENSDFEIEVLDLKEINLPFLDEETHPRLGQYKNEHTLHWSQAIDSGDAYVFVTPEYNYSFPATIKNALDYLHNEWTEKPVGFVSYGGISAGTRAVQELKSPITTLGMMPLPQAVNVPFYSQFINADNKFVPNDKTIDAAKTLLTALMRWAKALKGMREEKRVQ